jgi:hypothetical protein
MYYRKRAFWDFLGLFETRAGNEKTPSFTGLYALLARIGKSDFRISTPVHSAALPPLQGA